MKEAKKVSHVAAAKSPVKSARTFDYKTVVRESGGGVSKTVPNKSLSIQMIFQKFSSGMPLPEVKDMEYTGDSTLPDIRVLDLVERANLIKHLKEHVVKVNEEYKKKLQLRRDTYAKDRERLNAALEYFEKQSQAPAAGGNEKV